MCPLKFICGVEQILMKSLLVVSVSNDPLSSGIPAMASVLDVRGLSAAAGDTTDFVYQYRRFAWGAVSLFQVHTSPD